MSDSKLTVIMYHYVREIRHSRYPNIKGLEVNLFKKQLDYILEHYRVVTCEQVTEAYYGNEPLPENAALLTFDDGYSDHFHHVFPILKNRGLQGSFFIPVKPVRDNRVLDVNKIHLMLEVVSDEELLTEIQKLLVHYKKEPEMLTCEEYFRELAVPGRFDPPEVVFIKQLLQHRLPDAVRKEMVSRLFDTFIPHPEQVIAKELYMTEEQCKCLVNEGMHVGAHTRDHVWLNHISEVEQQAQFMDNLSFLEELGVDSNYLTMAYPYGGYNDSTLKIMNDTHMKLGFTTTVDREFKVGTYHPFELPRLDTNDLPQ